MSEYQINNQDTYDAIRGKFFDLIARANDLGLPYDNVIIRLSPELADALEMKDSLTLGFPFTPLFEVPVVRDDAMESRAVAGGHRSDILIYSPDWVKEQPEDDR